MTGTLVPLLMAMGIALAPPQSSPADSPEAILDTAAAISQPVSGAADAGAFTPGGLPARATPPRTMRDQWPVFAVFAVSWVVIIGYLVATGRKSRRLAADMAAREGRR